ncbi:hypothetical protein L5515_006684 [Caenorhabditis briggsae]|uniref:Nuclear receptor domain-containing protein n=1 Tax=Caenorhabditis briggsae TaxID=6238 RepID=A0AAE9F126_CAEBR|nr:hypothetical protein L5515_006684 [Caenorhabditis briggsae]
MHPWFGWKTASRHAKKTPSAEKTTIKYLEEKIMSPPESSNNTNSTTSRKGGKRSKNYKHLLQNQSPTECRICEKPAIGFQFEVPCCNTCKVFFRRAIITGYNLECYRPNQCSRMNDQ